jgi:hypothetical protein
LCFKILVLQKMKGFLCFFGFMPPKSPNGSDVLQSHKALASMPPASTAATMAAATTGCEDLSEPDSGTAPITPLSRIPLSSANNGA